MNNQPDIVSPADGNLSAESLNTATMETMKMLDDFLNPPAQEVAAHIPTDEYSESQSGVSDLDPLIPIARKYFALVDWCNHRDNPDDIPENLEKIIEELFDEIANTEATSMAGIAIKLRAFLEPDWIGEYPNKEEEVRDDYHPILWKTLRNVDRLAQQQGMPNLLHNHYAGMSMNELRDLFLSLTGIDVSQFGPPSPSPLSLSTEQMCNIGFVPDGVYKLCEKWWETERSFSKCESAGQISEGTNLQSELLDNLICTKSKSWQAAASKLQIARSVLDDEDGPPSGTYEALMECALDELFEFWGIEKTPNEDGN